MKKILFVLLVAFCGVSFGADCDESCKKVFCNESCKKLCEGKENVNQCMGSCRVVCTDARYHHKTPSPNETSHTHEIR